MPEDKTNLARIRDNQRRSRARRKEYLQELEARLRKCELQGVEASSQVQLAARRVANENRRLRELLSKRGVTQEGVDAYMQSNSVVAVPEGRSVCGGDAVQILERTLLTQKCCPDGRPKGSNWGQGEASDALGFEESNQQPGQEAAQLSLPNTPPFPIATNSNQAIDWSQAASKSPERGFSASPGISQSVAQTEVLYPPPPQLERFQEAPQSVNDNPALTDHFSSCTFATDMITTMAGGDPSTVRAELGCAPGTECEIDNNLAFSVMDRYTSYASLEL